MTPQLALLLGGAGVVLLVLLAEVTSRFCLRRSGYFVFPPGMRLHLTVDLDQAPGLDPLARFEINRDGERGPEPPADPTDCYRVLTSGGSAAEGFLLDEPRSWPGVVRGIMEQPENLKRLRSGAVHVGSVGRSRTGAEALGLIFERTLGRYPRLDAIVIMVGATDVVEWIEAGAPEDWLPPPVTAQDLFGEHQEVVYGWMPQSTAIWDAMRWIRRRWLKPVEHRSKVGGTLERVRSMRANAKLMRDEISSPTRMLDHFGEHMGRLLRRAREHADLVIVLGQPCFDRNQDEESIKRFWDFGVGNPYHEEVTTYFSLSVAGQVMAAMNARAREVVEREGAVFLDLGAEIEPGVDVFYDYLHFTPEGASRVGAAIARQILASQTHS